MERRALGKSGLTVPVVMRPLGQGGLVRSMPSERDLRPLTAFGVRTWATSKPERMTENAGAGAPPWFDREARDYVVRLAASSARGR